MLHFTFELAGDFNRDLNLKSDNYSKHDISEALSENHQFNNLFVKSVPASSFIAKYNSESGNSNVVVETRDGILSTMELHVEYLLDINRLNAQQVVGKKISQHLSNIPEKFLEHLEEYQ